MKRIITLSLLTIIMVMPMFSQPRSHAPLRHRPALGPIASRSHLQSRSYNSNSRRFLPIDTYYGLRIGTGISTVMSDDNRLDGGSPKTGLNLGFVTGFQLEPATPIYVETGLLYAEKGGKGDYHGSFTYSMNYLEVPLVLKYMHNFDTRTSLQPFAGVYGALGVSGQMKNFEQREAYSVFDDDGFRRLDAGLRLGCGLQFDFLYAEMGYDLGLTNISRDFFDNSHTGSFFANIGVNC